VEWYRCRRDWWEPLLAARPGFEEQYARRDA
jgi:hypothetical protein